MKKQKTSNTKKLLIIGLALLLVLGGSAVLLKRRSDARKRAQAAETQAQETITYAPATSEEKQAAEDNKKNLPDSTTTTTPPPTNGLKKVTVTITSLDTNPVRARVDGVVEDTDNGCTVTFTKGAETFSVSAASVANVSNTVCAIRPDRTLTSGQWQVTVTFKSNTAEGASTTQTITIQ